MGFWYCAFYLAALGILAHFLGEAAPRSWFDAQKFPYRCFAFEKQGHIYKKLGVHRWKDRVPDMSRVLPGMRPKRLRGLDKSDASLQALVQETCVAELTHWVLLLLAPVNSLLWPGVGGAAVTAADMLLLNLPFILIQRYNRPKLLALLQRRRQKTQK